MPAQTTGTSRHARRRKPRRTWHVVARAGMRRIARRASRLIDFWTKVSNDWILNFSGTLAYGFLTSIAPILLIIITLGGIFLGAVMRHGQTQMENAIARLLPGGSGGSGRAFIIAATHILTISAGPLLIVGIVGALIAGSGLFVTMENVFGVIYRLRGRSLIHQRLMSVGMLLIFAVLVPLMIVVSAVPPAILSALGIGDRNPVGALIIQLIGLALAFVFAAVFFAVIYIVVPNKPLRLNEVWKGTLVAATLLMLYEALFPLYENAIIHPGHLGPLVGFAVVIIIFFYYLAFIVCIGAEVNSWAIGQRQTAGPIDAILHEVQAHDTARGAAGPTAGQPHEDLQTREGATAMRNTGRAIHHERGEHARDQQPPRYAESGVTGHGYVITGGRDEPEDERDEHDRHGQQPEAAQRGDPAT